MPPSIVVPVVAHRVFGTRYTRVQTEADGRASGLSLRLDRAGSSPVFLRDIDRDHGTRRSLDEVREMFHPEGRLPHAAGHSVNTLWQGAGIRFLLLGISDQMIESELADLSPVDARLQPPWHRFNYAHAINVYYCRTVEGATGRTAHDVHPERPDQKGHVLISDDFHVAARAARPEASWRLDVVVLAHELGHALTLPHSRHASNLMYGAGADEESLDITRVQALVAQQHGRRYRRPWFRHEEDLRVTEIPSARGYLGERIPQF